MVSDMIDFQDLSFTFFEEIYVFGSALWSDSPNDIDILLVYDGTRLQEVETERSRLEAEMRSVIGDVDFHFTTLSRTEMQQTGFLELVRYEKLK